ncbi:helix-turn-helix domain-containing protein [Aeromonas veronii]|uniref:helix-turn-helix domain-containing protein n=1 Tax=Aeromonas veronii TaxID=654 RepID=UPI0032EFD1A3
MDSKALIQAYMRAKKLSQYQQVAVELGFTKSHISSLTTGKVQLTDATAKKIAQEIGLDVQEVLLSLAAVRETDPELKQAWYDILAKYTKGTSTALALGIAVLLAPSPGPDLTAHNVVQHYVEGLPPASIPKGQGDATRPLRGTRSGIVATTERP